MGTKRKLVILVAVIAFCLYNPLPADIAEREKLHWIDLLFRLLYNYPVNYGWFLGHHFQLQWARKSLSFIFRLGRPGPTPDLEIEDTDFDGVPVRLYRPNEAEQERGAIIFIHGGAFITGELDDCDSLAREFARHSKLLLISIGYRLAPEHVFPAAVEDCETAVSYFLREGPARFRIDPAKVVIMGESAGGTLATVTARRIRDSQHLPNIKLQILLYPVIQWVDFLTPSYQHFAAYRRSHLLDPEVMAGALLFYVGLEATSKNISKITANQHVDTPNPYLSHEDLPAAFFNHSPYRRPSENGEKDQKLVELFRPYLFNPDFSPIMAPDLSGLPKTLILSCHYDILRDEGYWYAKRLNESNVQVTWKHVETGFHSFLSLYSVMDLAKEEIKAIVKYIHINI